MSSAGELPSVPLVDLTRQHQALALELEAAFKRVLEGSRFILGDEVAAFERDFAESVGAEYGVGVSSGSDALSLALRAAGVVPGDEVVTTSFSFFATVGSILNVGAVPRFADVEADGFNIDSASVSRLMTGRTKAVVCVHLFGAPADTQALRRVCAQHGAVLIEDAAQAYGGRREGSPVGSLGDIACFSFFPSKPLGGLGDGGMVTTSKAEVAARVRLLRAHGASRPHHHDLLGSNHRLDALQAAFLAAKLPHLPEWRRMRQAHADAYDEALSACRGVRTFPSWPSIVSANYCLRLVGSAVRRADLLAQLGRRGVQTAVYYERPLYRQPVPELARVLSGVEASQCPNTERLCGEIFAIPMFPEMTRDERGHVIRSVTECLEGEP